MSAISLKGNASGTGTLSIAAPNTNTNQTLTLPDLTGTLAVNGPAFSAYLVGSQTPAASTYTKVLVDTELWDTNSNFASSRFTPTVAGYYQFNAVFGIGVSATTIAALFKNGTVFKTSPVYVLQNGNSVSGSVYLNGSTDYVEFYCYTTTSTALSNSSSSQTWFDGAMVRAA